MINKTKQAKDLKEGEIISVPAILLGKIGHASYPVSVIRIVAAEDGCAIATAAGIVHCHPERKFQLLEDEMHTDDKMPQFPAARGSGRRSVD
jgi:hypothetical protein